MAVFIAGFAVGKFDGAPLAYAYDDPGHFYTTAAALNHLNSSLLNQDERELIAFCAWLPDETRELSATGVFADAASPTDPHTLWFLWEPGCLVSRLFGGCPTILPKSTGGRLVIVQQLLHGLTGGDSAAVTRVAGSLMMNFEGQVRTAKAAKQPVDPNLLCALGLSIHLYGDSLAHRQLKDDSKMYDTGWGHARDGHHPDHPCVARYREKAWEYYTRAIGWVFTQHLPSVDNDMERKLGYAASDCVGAYDPVSDDNDAILRGILIGLLPPGHQWLLRSDRRLGDACEAYVERSRDQDIIPLMAFTGPKVLTCRNTWEIYKRRAEQMLFSAKGAIGSSSGYPRDYYSSVPQWLK